MMLDRRGARRPIVLCAAVLAYLVSVVFWPILGFEFVRYDVREQLLDNPRVHDLTVENLKHIFTSRCITSYYPVRTLTFAVDHQLWGLKAAGFKLTNGLIHLTNVFLFFWLVLRLFRHPPLADPLPPRGWDVSVATFAAGVFAVHPVVVESVVWVAGREELLMTLGTLGCLHFHFTARCPSKQRGGTPAAACYAGAAFCCAVACLSNVVAAVIPLLVVTWDVLTLSRTKLGRIVWGSSLLWAIGAAAIVIKRLGPEYQLAAAGAGGSSAQRVMLVLNVYWLNLKTLVWPTKLAVHYSEVVPGSFLNAEVLLGGLAMGLTCLALWRLRRRTFVLLGLLWFGLALGPVSQIMPHHISRADRFLYLPLVGLAVALGAGLRPLGNRLKGRRAVAAAIVPGVLVLFLLVTVSARQVQTWRDGVSMWQNCLRVDPDNVFAYAGLASDLVNRKQFDEAVYNYRAALRIDPNSVDILEHFALLLATRPNEPLRDYDLAIRLASRACESMQWPDPDTVMILAEVYARAGHREMAIATTQRAIELARALGDDPAADEFQYQLKLYRDRVEEGSAP